MIRVLLPLQLLFRCKVPISPLWQPILMSLRHRRVAAVAVQAATSRKPENRRRESLNMCFPHCMFLNLVDRKSFFWSTERSSEPRLQLCPRLLPAHLSPGHGEGWQLSCDLDLLGSGAFCETSVRGAGQTVAVVRPKPDTEQKPHLWWY